MIDTISKYDEWDIRELDRGLEDHVPETAPGEGIRELLEQASPVPAWAQWYYSIRNQDAPGSNEWPTEQEQPLQWRDLSSNEVYHVACLENEARDVTARYIIEATTVNAEEEGVAGVSHRYSIIAANRQRYMGLIANAEARAEAWFEDQVLLRQGELPVPPPPPIEGVRAWLQEQLTHDAVAKLPKGEVARIAGLHPCNFSTYCHNKERSAAISVRSMTRLAVGIADIRGLKGEEREQLIASALTARINGRAERDKLRREGFVESADS